MNDREFITMVINSYLSYAIDPHMATLNNTVANRLNDIANKLEKQKKVLKIIFEKRVDICILTDCDNVNEYNKSLGNFRPVEDRLTYEEFDLIKGMMSCN